LPLAAGIVVAALVLQSSYGGGAKLVVARWAPQARFNSIIAAGKSTSRATRSIYRPCARRRQHHRQATSLAQTAPQDARADSYRRVSGSHTVAANDRARSRELERTIEQLKANQQQ